jgi:hypothetical protein
MTITGCVVKGTQARTLTLSNPLAVPDESGVPLRARSAAGTPKGPTAPTGLKIEPGGGTLTDSSPATLETAPRGMTGYRLTGAGVTGFVGKRVRVTGFVVRPAPASSAVVSNTPGRQLPEFRVQSVQLSPGTCSQPSFSISPEQR